MINTIEDCISKFKGVPNFDTAVRLQVDYTAEVVNGTAYEYIHAECQSEYFFYFLL
jgi:hypothetical protein